MGEFKFPAGRDVGQASTTRWSGAPFALLVGALIASCPSLASAQGRSSEAQSRFGIVTLSTEADRVSGGDVLVQITYPGNARSKPLVIRLNGQDVSGAFKPGKAPNSLLGLVTGLHLGQNLLEVDGKGWGLA